MGKLDGMTSCAGAMSCPGLRSVASFRRLRRWLEEAVVGDAHPP
jgi:hypothetical protein